MASVIEELLSWSSARPSWQQDALRRFFTEGEISDDTIDLYARSALDQNDVGLEPLKEAHVRASGESPPVVLRGIHHLENVNALLPGEHLTFGEEGLTVVYGDNGSGKSGFARILKQVTRTRAQEPLRNNIFREENLTPRALVEYRIGDDEHETTWEPDIAGPDDLSRVSFFDRSCTEIYLSRETDVAFRPFGLGAFDELVRTCERVRTRLDAIRADAEQETIQLPELSEDTLAGRFLSDLTDATSDAEIREATRFGPEQIERLEELERVIAADDQGNAQREAERCRKLASRIDHACQILRDVEEQISDSRQAALEELWSNLSKARETAKVARERGLNSAELDGVGEDTWRRLWEAARDFSDNVAYPGRSFPVLDEVCVLCQQPLQQEAQNRLSEFDQFVRDTAQRAVDEAERGFTAASDDLQAVSLDDESLRHLIEDLTPDHATAAENLHSYLDAAAERLTNLRRLMEGQGVGETIEPAPTPPVDELTGVAAALRSRSDTLDKASTDEAGTALRDEHRNLSALNDLSAAHDDVKALRDRLKVQASIKKAKSTTNTKAITQKGAEVADEVLTEILADRFSRESDRLGMENVVLRSVGGRKGVLRYRTGFVGAIQDAPLPEVLSEGEQAALGMAGFLSEVWTDSSESAVVFDDPVTSLDHARRDRVAERLAQVAEGRQVIVFTHDIAFVRSLKKHATHRSVAVTERSVERQGSDPGHCREDHKFSAKLVKERLAELQELLDTLRRETDELSADEYRERTEHWYKLLRRTWERAIEETLLGSILTRDDLEVHPRMVRTLIAFSAHDNAELQMGYGRASELFGGHEESGIENRPAPNPNELQADLETLRAWHKRVVARRNLSEEKLQAYVVAPDV